MAPGASGRGHWMTLPSGRSTRWGGAAMHLSPQSHVLCFRACPVGPTLPPTCTPNHSSVTGVTVPCVKGSGCPSLSVSTKPLVPLAAVCVCVCGYTHVFSSIRCTRYLLRAHCVLGTVAESCGCLSVPLLLLWGPRLCFFVPKLLPLCRSGCLRFYVSLCVSLSVPVSARPSVSLLHVWPGSGCPLDCLALCRPLDCPGPVSLPDP